MSTFLPMRPTQTAAASAASVFFLCALAACGKETLPENPRIPVRVMTVGGTSNVATDMAAYSGVILPRVESAVSFRVAGRLIERRIDVGDSVVAGTVLAVLDPAPFRLAVNAARSAVASASAQQQQTASDVSRNAPLAAERIVAPAQFDALKTAKDAATARLQEAQANLAAAQDNLGYAALRAPATGVVTQVSAEIGQYLAPGEVAFRIAQPDTLEAVIDVPESVVGSLAAGTPATVQLLSSPNQALKARIREVAPAADAATRTYRVRVTLADADAARMGMTARVRFASTSAQQSLSSTVRVPIAAIFNRQKQTAVWVVKRDGKSLELRTVTVGAFESTTATVTDGLRSGDQIVTAGVHRLDARQSVRIWDGRLP